MPDLVPLSSLAEINPRKDIRISDADAVVSFIPMGDVSESGEWVQKQTRRLRQVDRGYTAFKEGDVLFAKITPCMENGKGCHAAGLSNSVGFGSTEFHVLRARPHADARFLYHWTQSAMLRQKAVSAMSGSAGQQRVKAWFFDAYNVPALHLTDQRRIAEVLDTVDAAIRQTDAVIAKQQQVKMGLLQDLLTRGLDEHGRLRDPERHPEQFKDSPLGRIPKTWEVTEFGDVILSGPQNGLYKPKSAYRDDEGGYRIVRIDSFYEGVLRNQQALRRLNLTDRELAKYGLQEGDLLINRVNSIGFIGKSAIIPRFNQPAVFESNIMRLVLDKERILPEYGISLLTSPVLKQQLRRRAKDAVAQSSINQQDVEGCLLPLPTIPEQQGIVEQSAMLQLQESEEQKYKNKLQRLKTGLMQDLLTGKVRVDEAEEILTDALV